MTTNDASTFCNPREAWFVPPATAATGGLAGLLRLLGVAPPARGSLTGSEITVATRRVRAGQSLFHEGTPLDSIHFVAVGTFKCLHIAVDGYEQVLGFHGRGEVLGYDAVCNGVHPTSVVALEDSSVLALSPADLAALCWQMPEVDRALQRELSRQLAQRVVVANLMAAVSAEVRLARFLVQQSDRMAECGQSPRRLLLRMGRRDIASHIGVAHETVSRSFGALVQWGCLAVCNREVEILDLQRLHACARSTRGLSDDEVDVAAEHGAHRAPMASPRADDALRCAA
jgi:CRP/FNR family transcriptional regulator, anaerobic regulatory protein